MSLVASTRLRRIERLVGPARAYAETLKGIVLDIAARTPPWAHPLLEPREAATRACLVITSDRGLAGSYNAEILRKATRLLGTADPVRNNVAVVVAGKKGRDFFRRRGLQPVREYVRLPETPDESLARRIAEDLLARYLEGEIDSVHVVFARFMSRGSYRPHIAQLLPIEGRRLAARRDEAQSPVTGNENDRVEVGEGAGPARDTGSPNGLDLQFVYEPSPESVLDRLFPHYLASAVYAALVEAKASEFAARTIAMDSATDNAGELIERLTLTYNRARQAEITQEISEIATGAESLR